MGEELASLRDRCRVASERLEKAEENVQRSKRSCTTLVTDCDVLRETRSALSLEFEELSSRLEDAGRARSQAAAAAALARADLDISMRRLGDEARVALARVGDAEVRNKNLDGKRLETAETVGRVRAHVADLKARISKAGNAFHDFRIHIDAGADRQRQRSQALRAACETTKAAITDTRS